MNPLLAKLLLDYPILGMCVKKADFDALDAALSRPPAPPCPPCPPPPPLGQGSGEGLGPQVTWTPADAPLGQAIGFFSFEDLGAPYDTLVFNHTSSVAGFDIEQMPQLVSVSWPNLVAIDPGGLQPGFITLYSNFALTSISLPLLQVVGGQLRFEDNPLITNLDLPALTSVGRDFQCLNSCTSLSAPNLFSVEGSLHLENDSVLNYSFPALTSVGNQVNIANSSSVVSVSMPNLVTCGATFILFGNPSLTSVNVPSFLPTGNNRIDCSNNALSAASVNMLLARCVASAGFGAESRIDLDGGTNAAPSGQGIVDKETLLARGVTVNTN